MNERTLMDRAGDLWMVEGPQTMGDGVGYRCRHELGYELTVRVDPDQASDEGALLAALERARRRDPRGALAEAA